VSGGHPLLGHTIDFLRDPVAVVDRGHRECGEVFALKLGTRTAVVLLGPDSSRFFFAETDGLLSIRTGMPAMRGVRLVLAARAWKSRTRMLAEPARRSSSNRRW